MCVYSSISQTSAHCHLPEAIGMSSFLLYLSVLGVVHVKKVSDLGCGF